MRNLFYISWVLLKNCSFFLARVIAGELEKESSLPKPTLYLHISWVADTDDFYQTKVCQLGSIPQNYFGNIFDSYNNNDLQKFYTETKFCNKIFIEFVQKFQNILQDNERIHQKILEIFFLTTAITTRTFRPFTLKLTFVIVILKF